MELQSSKNIVDEHYEPESKLPIVKTVSVAKSRKVTVKALMYISKCSRIITNPIEEHWVKAFQIA